MPRDRVFISYSHEDIKWRKDLEKHLKPYLRAGSIKGWSDEQIVPGSTWFGEIKSALLQTNVAVLLVTPAFLASNFIHEHELGPLLKEAERGGVTILWVPIYASAYKQTALEKYQAVLDPKKPLGSFSKAKRDEAWVKICEEIGKAVNSSREPICQDSLKDAAPQSATAPEPPQRAPSSAVVRCCVLLREALSCALSASYGGGPTTHLHRRLELAEKWALQARELLKRPSDSRLVNCADYFGHMAQSVLGLISEARVHLPKPGEADEKSRESKFFSEAKDHTRSKERQLSDWLESEGVLDDLDEQGKWAILGFTDKESFDDFIYPRLHQLIQGADPMIADLARRLLRDPAFTPVELAGEGYQKAIVMDLLNALLREHWAIWTDLSVLGERAKGTVTQVGQRLLRKLVDVDCR